MVQQRKRYGPETVLDQIETRNLVWNPVTLAYEPAMLEEQEIIDCLAKYKFTAKDPTETYFGFTDRNGAWYIMKIGEEFALYTKGDSDFLTAWAGKEGLPYDYFFNCGF